MPMVFVPILVVVVPAPFFERLRLTTTLLIVIDDIPDVLNEKALPEVHWCFA